MGTSKSWRMLENMEKAVLARLCLTEATGQTSRGGQGRPHTPSWDTQIGLWQEPEHSALCPTVGLEPQAPQVTLSLFLSTSLYSGLTKPSADSAERSLGLESNIPHSLPSCH